VTPTSHYAVCPKGHFKSGWSSTLWHSNKEDSGIKETEVPMEGKSIKTEWQSDGSENLHPVTVSKVRDMIHVITNYPRMYGWL
jgi:hypothetical protein